MPAEEAKRRVSSREFTRWRLLIQQERAEEFDLLDRKDLALAYLRYELYILTVEVVNILRSGRERIKITRKPRDFMVTRQKFKPKVRSVRYQEGAVKSAEERKAIVDDMMQQQWMRAVGIFSRPV